MKRGAWLALVLLAACSPSLPNSPAVEIHPTATESFTELAPTLPGAPPPPERQPPRYLLNATLDYDAHYLAVFETITYINNSSDTLDEIPLLVEADHLGASFTVDALYFDRGTEWDYQPGQILVTLARPLQPSEQFRLDLHYSLTLPQVPGSLGWTERQANFVDWYPYIPPYQSGSGWLINPPAPQGEHLTYESANFEVQISLVNAPALVQVAASAPARQAGTATFAYTLKNARRFSWSASGHYKTESTQSADGIPVTVYFFEEERDAAEVSMRTAAQALDVYSELFGAYPYESLSIVECSFPDGMESDGLFFLDMTYFRSYNYKTTNLLTTLTAHETAHNWWYGSVGNDQANEPWLDEALATYSEMLFYEKTYPNDVTWWWDFRVNQWAPTGWVDSTIYEHAEFRPYVNAVYLRGAQFLQSLRDAIGDKAFFLFLKDYAQQGASQIVTTEDFFRLIGKLTDKDLISLFSEYFRLTD